MTCKEEIIAVLNALNLDDCNCDNAYIVRHRMLDLGFQESDFSVAEGASKMCLILKDKDYVIKWTDDDMNTEAEDEAHIYQKALQEHLEVFFPKTAILCRLRGVTYVIQERIDTSMYDANPKQVNNLSRIGKTVREEIFEKMEHEFKKASRRYSRDLDEKWGKAVISLYGKRKVKHLCRFIIENAINDLHYSNIGIKNGKPIILDFSGYHR